MTLSHLQSSIVPLALDVGYFDLRVYESSCVEGTSEMWCGKWLFFFIVYKYMSRCVMIDISS